MIKQKVIFQKFSILKLHYQKLGLVKLTHYIFQRIFWKENALLKVFVPGYEYPVYLRNTPSDIQIFTQIFLREELKIDLEKSPINIIDGGANIGLAALYLNKRYPGSAIFSVEPDHSNFDVLIKNTSAYENIVCYNKGIWNKNTKLKIINKEAGNESFIVQELTINDLSDNFINAITIDEIVTINKIEKINLLKLDIEGSERNVFADNYENWLSKTDNMLVEIHNWIDADAEKAVMSAVGNRFHISMAGEYHFFLMRPF